MEKYTMSMFSNIHSLKIAIVNDQEMSDIEKLKRIFHIDKEKITSQFPELAQCIQNVLVDQMEVL